MSDYSRFKNHLHNTLEISKQDIRDMVQKAVDKIVERKMDVMFSDQWNVQRLVDKAIARNLEARGWYWGESEDSLDDYIKKEVVRELLHGVKLKVDIARTKKEATPNPMTVRARKIKRNGK